MLGLRTGSVEACLARCFNTYTYASILYYTSAKAAKINNKLVILKSYLSRIILTDFSGKILYKIIILTCSICEFDDSRISTEITIEITDEYTKISLN